MPYFAPGLAIEERRRHRRAGQGRAYVLADRRRAGLHPAISRTGARRRVLTWKNDERATAALAERRQDGVLQRVALVRCPMPRSSSSANVGDMPSADLPSAAIARMTCPPPSPSYSISRRGERRKVNCV